MSEEKLIRMKSIRNGLNLNHIKLSDWCCKICFAKDYSEVIISNYNLRILVESTIESKVDNFYLMRSANNNFFRIRFFFNKMNDYLGFNISREYSLKSPIIPKPTFRSGIHLHVKNYYSGIRSHQSISLGTPIGPMDCDFHDD